MTTRRERLVLSFGALTIMGLFSVRSLVPLVSEQLGTARDDGREVSSVIGRRRGLAASQAWIAESLRVRATANARLNQRLLPPMSVAEGQSELAVLLRILADESEVSVGSMTMLPDSTVVGEFRQVAVGVETSGNVEAIASFLMAIEHDQLLLRVRRLSITATVLDGPAPPDLRGQFTVDALVRIETEVQVK